MISIFIAAGLGTEPLYGPTGGHPLRRRWRPRRCAASTNLLALCLLGGLRDSYVPTPRVPKNSSASPAKGRQIRWQTGRQCCTRVSQSITTVAGAGVGQSAAAVRGTTARSTPASSAASACAAALPHDRDGETGSPTAGCPDGPMVQAPGSLIVTGMLKLPFASARVDAGAAGVNFDKPALLRRPDGPVMKKLMTSRPGIPYRKK